MITKIFIALLAAINLASPLSADVHSGPNIPPLFGDETGDKVSSLLAETQHTSNRFREMKPDEVAKRCDHGIRITFTGSHDQPRTLVFLLGIKRYKNEPPFSLAWEEYHYIDYTALVLHRAAKAIPIVDTKKVQNTITETALWKLPDQRDIPDFKDGVRDGYNYRIELFSGGKAKVLNYHAPSSFNEPNNNQFRDGLFRLLQSLDRPALPFGVKSPELSQRRQTKQGEDR